MLDGRTYTIEEAAVAHGLKLETVGRRLERGATPEEAVLPRREARRVEVDGEPAYDACDSVRRRLAEGWPEEQVNGGAYFRGKPSRAATMDLLAS